jgi:hypothetical protein
LLPCSHSTTRSWDASSQAQLHLPINDQYHCVSMPRAYASCLIEQARCQDDESPGAGGLVERDGDA